MFRVIQIHVSPLDKLLSEVLKEIAMLKMDQGCKF